MKTTIRGRLNKTKIPVECKISGSIRNVPIYEESAFTRNYTIQTEQESGKYQYVEAKKLHNGPVACTPDK